MRGRRMKKKAQGPSWWECVVACSVLKTTIRWVSLHMVLLLWAVATRWRVAHFTLPKTVSYLLSSVSSWHWRLLSNSARVFGGHSSSRSLWRLQLRMWRDVLNPKNGRLLFRFDPERDLVQIQERGEKLTIDLAEFRKA